MTENEMLQAIYSDMQNMKNDMQEMAVFPSKWEVKPAARRSC